MGRRRGAHAAAALAAAALALALLPFAGAQHADLAPLQAILTSNPGLGWTGPDPCGALPQQLSLGGGAVSTMQGWQICACSGGSTCLHILPT